MMAIAPRRKFYFSGYPVNQDLDDYFRFANYTDKGFCLTMARP